MKIEAICQKCKIEFSFEVGHQKRGKKYCSKQCYNRAKWSRKYWKNKESILSKIKVKVRERNKGKVCFTCSKIFDAYRSNQIFCSFKCCKKVHGAMHEHRKYNQGRGSNKTHTRYEWEEIKARYCYCCVKCGIQEPDVKLEEDHIIPISKGGEDIIENIQPLCRSCNSQKYNKEIDYRWDRLESK